MTVVVAIEGGGSLAAALAALAGQTYPAHLLDVVVVVADDRCLTPAMPALRPPNCRIVRCHGGRAAARAHGVEQSSGAIVCWLDGDIIAGPRHIEAHARWLHAHTALATIGRVWTAQAEHARPGQQRMIQRTGGLRTVDHLGFEAFTVPGAAVSRSLYKQVGGLDPTITTGQGLEFGYRLWQAGAVLVPEPRATACATGSQATRRSPSDSARLADRMPQPRWLRDHATPEPRSDTPRDAPDPTTEGSTARGVPLVRAVVPVSGAPFERVRDCLDHVLAANERDLHVTAVHAPSTHPRDDGDWELRLTQAHFMDERRVTFSAVAPTTAFPSPYLLELPVDWALAPHTVTKMLAHADRTRAGLVELTVPGHGTVVRLWRTRALCRGLRVRHAAESRAEVVTAVHGRRRLRAARGDVTPIRPPEGTEARRVGPVPPDAGAEPRRPRWWNLAARLGQARSAIRRIRARRPSS
ncbi:glycosyltransferase [Spiractinospora alimapuensis]|uniref:glycosyltransferase n=1 Tax=Spiractinospora alimapuensis TaxID=2820884 RepID=UPI001F426DF1|nr:glycosyltransferase [Spiractinospora alimapuensis]QVQ52537.1 glycosyltransferase [Spiractinospora alimapuensis]